MQTNMHLPAFLSFEKLKALLLRFPFSVLSSAAATGLIIWQIQTIYPNELPRYIEKLIACGIIGVILFAALTVIAESYKLRKWLMPLFGLPILYGFLYIFSTDFEIPFAIHIFATAFASGCLLFSAPYFISKNDKHFWYFVAQIVEAFALAWISAMILMGGFSLALFSIEKLFTVTIAGETYATMNAVLGLFLGSLILLSGIPTDFKATAKKELVTKLLKFFTYYLSFPLLATYFGILGVYLAKILITWNWPNGFVATPILIFAAIGMVTFFLITPLKEQAEFKAVRFFTKVFFWILLAFLVMYFMGFWQRISEYGITEMRYFGIVLGAWLTGLSLYFAVYKNASLNLIPITFFILALLSTVGPWGAFSVSEGSQIDRLEYILTEDGLLVDGTIHKSSDQAISAYDRVNISSILTYLEGNHGFKKLMPIIGKTIEPDMTTDNLLKEMGITYAYSFHDENGMMYVNGDYYRNYFVDNTKAITASGYMEYFEFPSSVWNEATCIENGSVKEGPINGLFTLSNGETVTACATMNNLNLQISGKTYKFTVPFATMLNELGSKYGENSMLQPEALTLITADSGKEIRILFKNLGGNYQNGELTNIDFTADVFLK
ncbi:MAG: DUF4153 domain-containing protein [Candidatus Gracilibacteria bacterium]|jgi:hypothetical protein